MSDKKLDLILMELQSMKNEMQTMKDDMNSMKDDMNSMKDEMNSMKDDMNSMKDEMNSMKDDMNSMKDEMNIIKSQLDENTELTKAIYHRQEETDAKLENLALDNEKLHEEIVSIKDCITQLSHDQLSIHELLGEHEVSIRTLRRRSI